MGIPVMIKLGNYVGLKKKEYLKLFSIHLGSLHRVLFNHFYGTTCNVKCLNNQSNFCLTLKLKKMRKQNRNNNWFIERIQTRMAFGWLSECLGEKTSCPRTFQKSIDTSPRRHTATRSANQMPSPYQGFLWWENKESMFRSFHPLADKTNNEHLPKPFFKVKRKSL